MRLDVKEGRAVQHVQPPNINVHVPDVPDLGDGFLVASSPIAR
jgi:hypothetical protein